MKKDLINVGIAGSPETDTGQRTSTLIEQVERLPSMRIVAVYCRDIGNAASMLREAGVSENFVEVHTRSIKTGNAEERLKKIQSETLRKNCGTNRENLAYDEPRIYTDDLQIFLSMESLDVIIVSEIDTESAASIIWNCLLRQKSVVNLNAVCEATLGLLFDSIARSSDVVYTVGAGDEPASTLDLINFCNRVGLEIVCAGKGKNNPLNPYAIPDDYKQKVIKDSHNQYKPKNAWFSGNVFEKANRSQAETGLHVSPRCVTSFVDGTKTMLEMCILSNATGIPIDKPGMHGPKANVKDLVDIFNLKTHGGILENIPAIDYAIGDIAPGVFVVFTCKQKSIIEELRYLKMGAGPNFVIYKPYHLGNIETPLSIYDVVERKTPTLVVKDKMITSVVARAKRDLKAGEYLDTIGGYTFSGLAISYKEMLKKCYVPICLVENAKVVKDIEKDEIITFDHVECDTTNVVYSLYHLQLKLL